MLLLIYTGRCEQAYEDNNWDSGYKSSDKVNLVYE